MALLASQQQMQLLGSVFRESSLGLLEYCTEDARKEVYSNFNHIKQRESIRLKPM
jgi:hypothetical protein